jgi:type IV pilus assembly protein PilW
VTGSVPPFSLSHGTGGSCTLKNATNDLGKTFVGGQVYPINSVTYYVRTGASGQPSLYRRIGTNAADELVEGIEQMQILYGEDLELASAPTTLGYGVPNYYVSANNVVDMARVVSLRISLLAATVDNNITARPVPYTFNGATTTPPSTDHKIRRVFNTTIAVRNRLH